MNTTELKTLSHTLRNLAVNDSANEHVLHEAAGIINDNARLIAGASSQDIGHAAKVFAAEADGLEAERNDLLALAKHIAAMAGDVYLAGHPEWNAILTEAEDAITKATL